jgi:NADPH2:quinone reductase
MKAIVIKAFGGPEVFEQREVAKPEPGPNQVLVRVFATSVNPVDYKVRRSGQWAGIHPPATIGYDIAGMIEAVGPGVDDLKPGDEVYYSPEVRGNQGSYAEYHVSPKEIVAKKPDNISFVEAAAVPLAGCTAWDGIVGRGRVQVGETVLVHGGAGGVGHFAIQLAKAAGAYIYTTCGDYDFDFVKQLGADRPIDYHSEDFIQIISKETNGQGVDLVLDCVGGDLVSKSIDITRPHGRIAGIVNMEGSLNKAYRRNITFESIYFERTRHKLDALTTLIERGQLRPMIDTVLPLEQVAEAHEKLEEGHVRGKIVLKVMEE